MLVFTDFSLYLHIVAKKKNMKDTSKETFTVNGVTFNMVKVEGGSFIMGTPDKKHSDLVNFFCGHESNYVKLFHFDGVDGTLKALYDFATGSLFFIYHGDDALMLDDTVVQVGACYEWPQSKVLKSGNGKQISYSSIASFFIENISPEEEREEARENENFSHFVSLSSFMIGETEVTQDLWEAVMGSNPSNFKGGKRPVENVSWANCQTFIEKLNQLTGRNFRLPTEAEWEFAAKGGIHGHYYKYPGGNGVREGYEDNIDDLGWYVKNSEKETHEVGKKQPNELGLYDMVGNVWEWCSDYFSRYPNKEEYIAGGLVNPKGPVSSRENLKVLRGGCWYNDALHCRTTVRVGIWLNDHCDGFGLRLALQD